MHWPVGAPALTFKKSSHFRKQDEMQIIVGCLQNHFLFCTFYSETLKEIANAMEPETIEASPLI